MPTGDRHQRIVRLTAWIRTGRISEIAVTNQNSTNPERVRSRPAGSLFSGESSSTRSTDELDSTHTGAEVRGFGATVDNGGWRVVLSSDGEDPISTRSGAGARLTARERAVLASSATGLSVTGVAAAQNLTPEAVRDALRSAIAKLGARSKLEAVIMALRAGTIDLPGQ